VAVSANAGRSLLALSVTNQSYHYGTTAEGYGARPETGVDDAHLTGATAANLVSASRLANLGSGE